MAVKNSEEMKPFLVFFTTFQAKRRMHRNCVFHVPPPATNRGYPIPRIHLLDHTRCRVQSRNLRTIRKRDILDFLRFRTLNRVFTLPRRRSALIQLLALPRILRRRDCHSGDVFQRQLVQTPASERARGRLGRRRSLSGLSNNAATNPSHPKRNTD